MFACKEHCDGSKSLVRGRDRGVSYWIERGSTLSVSQQNPASGGFEKANVALDDCMQSVYCGCSEISGERTDTGP